LVVAHSSCHMMTFLVLVANAGWSVTTYQDRAVAYLGENPKRQMSVTRVDLHPVVSFDEDFSVTTEEMATMQHRTHRYHFIANSLGYSVEVNIV